MRRVIIESPYAGKTPEERRRYEIYLRACLLDCLKNGEAPFASHGLYTQEGVLLDIFAKDRTDGIFAGWAWMEVADAVVVYEDFGVSQGMKAGIIAAEGMKKTIEYRKLYGHSRRDIDRERPAGQEATVLQRTDDVQGPKAPSPTKNPTGGTGM